MKQLKPLLTQTVIKKGPMHLGLTIRQINCLIQRYQKEGKASFIHENQGKQHNHLPFSFLYRSGEIPSCFLKKADK